MFTKRPWSVAAKSAGSTLMATVRSSRCVAGAVDLAHSAGAERAGDFVGAEASARGERHQDWAGGL